MPISGSASNCWAGPCFTPGTGPASDRAGFYAVTVGPASSVSNYRVLARIGVSVRWSLVFLTRSSNRPGVGLKPMT